MGGGHFVTVDDKIRKILLFLLLYCGPKKRHNNVVYVSAVGEGTTSYSTEVLIGPEESNNKCVKLKHFPFDINDNIFLL
jgi:hypothetical protein